MNWPPAPELQDLPLGHVGIGDCAFTTRPMLFTTVLGSCVSATFHHPGSHAGGMFHAMLPDRSLTRPNSKSPACTYADMAVEGMLERFAKAGMPAQELVVKLFGGANTMQAAHPPRLRDMLDVGRKNVESALAALARHGLRPKAQDVLGALGRKLFFSTVSGDVWLTYLGPEQTRQTIETQTASVKVPER